MLYRIPGTTLRSHPPPKMLRMYQHVWHMDAITSLLCHSTNYKVALSSMEAGKGDFLKTFGVKGASAGK